MSNGRKKRGNRISISDLPDRILSLEKAREHFMETGQKLGYDVIGPKGGPKEKGKVGDIFRIIDTEKEMPKEDIMKRASKFFYSGREKEFPWLPGPDKIIEMLRTGEDPEKVALALKKKALDYEREIIEKIRAGKLDPSDIKLARPPHVPESAELTVWKVGTPRYDKRKKKFTGENRKDYRLVWVWEEVLPDGKKDRKTVLAFNKKHIWIPYDIADLFLEAIKEDEEGVTPDRLLYNRKILPAPSLTWAAGKFGKYDILPPGLGGKIGTDWPDPGMEYVRLLIGRLERSGRLTPEEVAGLRRMAGMDVGRSGSEVTTEETTEVPLPSPEEENERKKRTRKEKEEQKILKLPVDPMRTAEIIANTVDKITAKALSSGKKEDFGKAALGLYSMFGFADSILYNLGEMNLDKEKKESLKERLKAVRKNILESIKDLDGKYLKKFGYEEEWVKKVMSSVYEIAKDGSLKEKDDDPNNDLGEIWIETDEMIKGNGKRITFPSIVLAFRGRKEYFKFKEAEFGFDLRNSGGFRFDGYEGVWRGLGSIDAIRRGEPNRYIGKVYEELKEEYKDSDKKPAPIELIDKYIEAFEKDKEREKILKLGIFKALTEGDGSNRKNVIMKITPEGKAYLYTEDRKLMKAIREYFSAELKNAEFIRMNAGPNAGKVRPIRSTGELPQNMPYYIMGKLAGLRKYLKEELGDEYSEVGFRVFDLRPSAVRDRFYELLDIELRDYQKRAVRKGIKARGGLIIAPTGAGKTEIGIGLISKFGKNSDAVFLVHNTNLLKQAAERIEKRLGVKVGKVGKSSKNIIDTPEGDINVMMVNTVARIISKIEKATGKDIRAIEDLDKTIEKMPESVLNDKEKRILKFLRNADIVIQDEAHHIKAETFSKIASILRTRSLYGLTATPFRDDPADILKVFAKLGRPVAKITYKELVKKGHIVPADMIFIDYKKVAPTPELIKKLRALGGRGKRGGSAEKYQMIVDTHIVNNEERNRIAAEMAVRAAKKGAKVIMFTTRVDHTGILKELLENKLWKKEVPRVIGAKAKEVKKLFDKFTKSKEGEIAVATNAFVGEGFDLPSLDTLIIVDAGGASRISALQRVGRALRPLRKDGAEKKKALIVDFYDVNAEYLSKHSRARMKLFSEDRYKEVFTVKGPFPPDKAGKIVEETAAKLYERSSGSGSNGDNRRENKRGKKTTSGKKSSTGKRKRRTSG